MTKDELKPPLLNYTLWLDRRGAFREDLCIDWEHQIETFLELEKFSEENCRMNCGSQRCPGVFDEEWRKGCKLFKKKIEEELKNETISLCR